MFQNNTSNSAGVMDANNIKTINLKNITCKNNMAHNFGGVLFYNSIV